MDMEMPLICPSCGARHYKYNLTMVERGLTCWRCTHFFTGSQSRVYLGENELWLSYLLIATEKMKADHKKNVNSQYEIKRTFIDNLIFWLLSIRRKQINKRANRRLT